MKWDGAIQLAVGAAIDSPGWPVVAWDRRHVVTLIVAVVTPERQPQLSTVIAFVLDAWTKNGSHCDVTTSFRSHPATPHMNPQKSPRFSSQRPQIIRNAFVSGQQATDAASLVADPQLTSTTPYQWCVGSWPHSTYARNGSDSVPAGM